MRCLTTALVLGLLGCPSTPHERRAEGAMVTGEPVKFELVKDQDVDIGHGATARLKSVMYAHVGGGQNLSLLQFTLTRDGKSEDVSLDHESSSPVKPAAHLGLSLAVEGVDAYHQPERGWLWVWP